MPRCVLPAFLAVLGAQLLAERLPSDSGAWYRDPLQWQTDGDGVWHVKGRGKALTVCERVPVCRRAEVSALVQVGASDPEGWSVAGVALAKDTRNFWHFAVVAGPEKGGGRRYFELCEMLDGQWLAQNSLKLALSEGEGKWEPGVPVRLRLKLDPTGIEGTAEKPDGTMLFRRRYEFTAKAVTVGRPALHAGGFEGAEYRGLQGEWQEPVPDEKLAKSSFPRYAVQSFVPGLKGKATGFFRVELRDGRWWAFDPLGRGFVPLGIDHVRYRGFYCEKLGYAPHGKKNDAKFANQEEWAVQSLDRLTSWGFNLLTASYDPSLLHRGLGHTVALSVGNRMALLGDEFDITPNEHRPCSAFPNVFHPEFESYCRYRVRNLAGPHVGDPWLFGYFLDNELAWWGRGANDTGLFDATMAKAATHTAKLGLRDVLKRHFGGDLAACNRAFGSKLATFDAVLALDRLPTATDEARAAKHAFLAECAERYFGTLHKAIREVDPDHMILGCRFAGGRVDPVVWEKAGTYSEILTFNFYGSVDLDRNVALADGRLETAPPLAERFGEFYKLGGGRPMMVTEWSFPALDSGLPCTHGAGQRFRTQAERTMATDVFSRTILSMPFMVGYDYFMWVDQPALGISTPFPENSNYGIINEDGGPYPGMVRVLSQVNLHDAPTVHRTGRAGVPAPVVDGGMEPPLLAGSEWLLWNQSDEPLPAGPLAMPAGNPPPGARWLARQDGEWKALDARSGGVLARVPAMAPQSHLYLKRVGGAPPALGPVGARYTRTGDSWTASCGKWQLAGAVGEGPFVQSIAFDGTPLGRYSGMVQQFAGANRWNEISLVTDAKGEASALGLVLTLTGEYRPTGDETAQGFRLVHRLVFPQEASHFSAQVLSATNLGEKPLDLRALFFRFHGAIGGDAEGDVPGEAVPRLWKGDPEAAWYDEKVDAFFGAAALNNSGVSIRFWLNKQGGQHPDAKWEHDAEIPPGQTFAPPVPLCVYGFAGKGGDWQTTARRVSARYNFHYVQEAQP